MNITTIGNQPAISTMEIAALVGKRHDHVLRDARKMLKELLEGGLPEVGESSGALGFEGTYLNDQGKPQPCLYLPRREAIIVITKYDVRKRALLVDRLEALEVAFAAAQQEKLPPPQSTQLSAPDLPRDLFDATGHSNLIERTGQAVARLGERLISSLWKVKREITNEVTYRIDVSDTKAIERDRYLAKQAVAAREDIKQASEKVDAVGGQVQELWRYLTREPDWVTMRDFLKDHGVVDPTGLVSRLSKEAEGYFTARSLRLQVATPKANLRASWFERSHLEQWWKQDGERLYQGFLKKRSAPVVRLAVDNGGEN